MVRVAGLLGYVFVRRDLLTYTCFCSIVLSTGFGFTYQAPRTAIPGEARATYGHQHLVERASLRSGAMCRRSGRCRCAQTSTASRAYHWIRGQNTIKLYVIIGIMEVFDRLLCAFAQDALDRFYLSTRGALETLQNTRKSAVFLSLVTVVTVAHALLLFVHLTTLNVVVNANEATALFALLVSNNFSEIKSTVFKPIYALDFI